MYILYTAYTKDGGGKSYLYTRILFMLVRCDKIRYCLHGRDKNKNKSTWKARRQSYPPVCGTPDFADVTQQSGTLHCKITRSENKSEACAKLSEFISEFSPNYLLGLRFSEVRLDLFVSFRCPLLCGVTEKLSPRY